MIFDSHAHYDDKQFNADRDELLSELLQNGIGYVVNVGADTASTERSIALAKKYPFIYAAAGVHPSDVGELDEDENNFKKIAAWCADEKCVAVGEIGLDYYWDKDPLVRERQKYWFRRQLQLSKEMKLPIIVHSRDAAKDTLDIIKSEDGQGTWGVIHCFSYSEEMAAEYVKLGYYIGIGGVVTFSNAKNVKAVAASVPIERILLETDCPYLSPVPNRGKRNSSLNLQYVAEAIAQLKGMSVCDVIDITCKNAMEMYRIDRLSGKTEV